jgi:hypothetical protein
MSVEERIGYLLRAAARAEGRGDLRVAGTVRRMAEDARPLRVGSVVHGHMHGQGPARGSRFI